MDARIRQTDRKFMGKVDVSVIIPTYNRAHHVLKAIASVQKQTCKPKRIIVVDDGSRDNTKNLVKGTYGNAVIYLNIEHSGLPAVARNRGLEAVETEWVAFLDSDDTWKPQKLQLQLAYLRQGKYGGVGTNAEVSRDDKRLTMYQNMPKSVEFRDLVESNWVVCSSFVGKTSFIRGAGGFPSEYRYRSYEDWMLWMRLSTYEPIALVNEKLVVYRDVPAESIRSNQEQWDGIRHELQTDIIRWGTGQLIRHPNKTRLIKDMFYARKYYKHD